MRLLLSMVLALGAGPTWAQTSSKPIDVIAWFTGCAALTRETAVAMQMDTNCLSDAADFCEIRPVMERAPCLEQLIVHLELRSVMLRKTLRDVVELSGFRKRTFDRMRADAEKPDAGIDCANLNHPTLPALLCDLLIGGMRWGYFRALYRMAAKAEERKDP